MYPSIHFLLVNCTVKKLEFGWANLNSNNNSFYIFLTLSKDFCLVDVFLLTYTFVFVKTSLIIIYCKQYCRVDQQCKV